MQQGKRDSFIKKGGVAGHGTKRINKEEQKATEFADKALATPAIVQAYQQSSSALKRPVPPKKTVRNELVDGLEAFSLPPALITAFKLHLGEDFTDVKLYADHLSTKIAIEHHAAALTVGEQVFFNTNVFEPGTLESLTLLAHELFHTIEPGDPIDNVEVQLKPLTEPADRTPYQKKALQRAALIAVGESGKVNSNAVNKDGTRVGWELLVEYFRTTFGDEQIIKDKSEYKPGKFLEEYIKFVRKGTATKVHVDKEGKHYNVQEPNVDLLPSWCGIFAFWALHKSGIHPPPWKVGVANFTEKDQYKKGAYLPRPGDIVIKNGYNHHALVVKTDPETVNEEKDLANLRVITINGNTAGTNHTGGQIQVKTDPYSYWDFYVNPLFKGVEVTDEKDFKLDERLKEQTGDTSPAPTATLTPANTTLAQYNTSLEAVKLHIPTEKPAEGGEKESEEKVQEPPIDPKQIMKADKAFAELHGTLDKNAKNEKAHDPAQQKADEAQASSISPPNERMSGAQANKIQGFENVKVPQFRAKDLKDNIMVEVRKMLEERKNATPDGEKPELSEGDVKKVKEKSEEDISNKKKESVGDVEKAHDQAPNLEAVPVRNSADRVIENAGPDKNIPHTEKAVAKPIADERITLEAESGKIDEKMAQNDVDETQLAESNEAQFTGALDKKTSSQEKAAAVKTDYRDIETGRLDKDKQAAKAGINNKTDLIHAVRDGEFGKVNSVKDATQSADEKKRKEVSDKIERIYTEAEKSVNDKLVTLDKSVNEDFDAIMAKANENFKISANRALDEEFSWEWASKTFSPGDYKNRVQKVFTAESKKYEDELSKALDPLTTRIADTLNAIIEEIQAARKAVKVFVDGLPKDLQDVGMESAKAVMEKFNTLQDSVNEKQQALTNSLAKKYADGVIGLEEQFKKIMDDRKSWLEKALDAIVDAIKEIIQLLADLKKALERAAEYGKRIIKAPLQFFGNLCRGASEGFNNFVKNIAKHLLQGALEWITGQMGDAGIVLPEKFDFKGILSIILQILGISIQNMKEIAKKVIGEKYVTMLEKGVDLGVKTGDKILQIFTIVKKDGLAGLWEFIKEQFNDLKEKLMEEAKTFIVTTIVEVAVVKIVSMLIPGAGFISAVKSLIDFLRTLFAKARQIVDIITGIIDTFGEILAGNVAKVSGMVEKVLAKFLGLAITFLAAILGLGKIGKKINDIIQKKIKDPINKAITKMMEKLKQLMTKLGIFKFLDKVDAKIKAGKQWVEDKKDKAKAKLKEGWDKAKSYFKNLFKSYKDQSGETHTLKIEEQGGKFKVMRHSLTLHLGNYLDTLWNENEAKNQNKPRYDEFKKLITASRRKNTRIDGLLAKTWTETVGEEIRQLLEDVAENLKQLPANIGQNKAAVPEVKTVTYGSTYTNKYSLLRRNNTVNANLSSQDGVSVDVPLLSINSKQFVGSEPSSGGSSEFWKVMNDSTLNFANRVRGHILNHQLFGTGGDVKNLAPIPIQANNDMKTVFENPAKETVHGGGVLHYWVKYAYGPPNDSEGKIAKRFPGIMLPTFVNYEIKTLALKQGIDSRKQSDVDKPGSWEEASSTGSRRFRINHDDFF